MALKSNVLEDQKLVKALDSLTQDYSPDDVELLKQIISNNNGSEMELLLSLMNYTYTHPPVPVRTFIEEEPYLGLKGQVYPKLLDDIEELFSGDYDEAVLAGSIGWGKSTLAEIAVAMMIYEVSCFKNPQKALGLMDGSVIAFINVSINKDSAKKVVFQGMKSKLENSRYFREYFPITNSKAEELRMKNNVWIFPVASGEQGILGFNVLGGVMDEVNFMDYIENSKRVSSAGGAYDQADRLQKALIRRMKSRYMKRGKLPGILLQVSSAAYPDDYTERRFLEAEDNPRIFCRRYSQWDTPPKDKYCGQVFQLSLGDLLNRPKIIGCKADLEECEKKNIEVIDVPIEYRTDFERDTDSSIRDLAGRPTLTIHPFIMYREKVQQAMERGPKEMELEHPFNMQSSTLQDGGMFIPDKLLIPKWKKRYENEEDPETKEKYRVIYSNLKQKPRYIHIDLAKTSMAGISMGHVHDYTEVIKKNDNGEEYTQRMPIIVIEFMLQIVAPQYGEIEISNVRSLVHELRSYGYRISKVTFDQYQSMDSQQQFIQQGIDSGLLSVDRTNDPYNAYKDALYEDRLITYWYETAYWETIRLEKNEKTGKIDHPKGFCFTGDTKVLLADGTELSFIELEERYKPHEEFYVHSVDTQPDINSVDKLQRIVKPARFSRNTMIATKLVVLLLDSGNTVRCTPEHLFMTADGKWVQAQNLTPDILLMSVDGSERRIQSLTIIDVDEPVYDITVPDTENFALAEGIFVHNSKDVSDTVAGVCFLCVENAPTTPATPPLFGKLSDGSKTGPNPTPIKSAMISNGGPKEEDFSWV